MPSSSGSGRVGLLLGVALLAAVAAALWFATSGDDPAAAPALGARPVASAGDDGAVLAAPTSDAVVLRAGVESSPDAVRLGGRGRLDGRVVEVASGRPVGGVRVTLGELPRTGAEFVGALGALFGTELQSARGLAPVAAVTSTADGRFSFAGVRPGEYFVEGRGALHVSAAVVRARVAESGDGGPIEVLVRPGGAVEGRVTTAGGRPAAGTIWLYHGPQTFFEAARAGDLARFETTLAKDGSFAFVGVPPGGPYDLSVVGPGTPLTHRPGVLVRAGDVTRVDFAAHAGGTVTGRVLSRDPVSGAGTPLAGAMVGPIPRGLRDLAFIAPMLREIGTRTGADGGYVLHDVPPGMIDVGALDLAHLPDRVAALQLTPGGSIVAPDLLLAPGEAIEGRCVDPTGAPIEGVEVRWEVVDLEELMLDFSFAPLMWRAQRFFSWPKSDAEGRFRAAPVRVDGRGGGLSLTKAGYWWDESKQPTRVEDGVTVFVLQSGGAIEGIVMDVASGRPCTSFTVEATPRAGSQSDRTGLSAVETVVVEGQQGRFAVEGVGPGRVTLVVRSPGFAAREMRVEVPAGEVTRGVVVELRRGGTIRGRVVDAAGTPVEAARVVALEEDRRRRDRGTFDIMREMFSAMPHETNAALGLGGGVGAVTDRDGRFELGRLNGERVELLATHPAHVAARSQVAMPEGADPGDIELVLGAGASLEGRVSDRFGRPLAGALVIASAAGGQGGRGGSAPSVHQATCDETGHYRISPLPGGGYVVLATRADEQFNVPSLTGSLSFDFVSVPAGEVVRFDLVDRSAGATRVVGTVYDRGVAVDGGAIAAMNLSSENVLGVDFKMARVATDGTFVFEGLAASDYQFTYQPRSGRGGDEIRTAVEVPERAEWRFDLHLPDAGVRGSVVSALDGRPIAGARVQLRPLDLPAPSGWLGTLIANDNRQLSRRTDADGRFWFDRVQSGDYELVATTDRSFAPSAPLRVRVDAGRTITGLVIELAPSLTITGTVRDSGGAPVPRARVRAVPVDGARAAAQNVRADAEGKYRLGGLSPGAHTLIASADGFAEARRDGFPLEDDAADVDFVLNVGARLELVVIGPDGRPAVGAIGRLVRVGADDSDASSRALQDLMGGRGVAGRDGRLEFAAVTPGRWNVQVWRGSARALVEGVELGEGELVDLRVDLR